MLASLVAELLPGQIAEQIPDSDNLSNTRSTTASMLRALRNEDETFGVFLRTRYEFPYNYQR